VNFAIQFRQGKREKKGRKGGCQDTAQLCCNSSNEEGAALYRFVRGGGGFREAVSIGEKKQGDKSRRGKLPPCSLSRKALPSTVKKEGGEAHSISHTAGP